MKIVINKCYGGFGLSEAAYERLIELGIPARPYVEEKRDAQTRLYLKEPRNEGRIIFDRTLYKDELSSFGRYWDSWTRDSRTDPLLVQVVEELGEKANGRRAKLKVVEIPDGVNYEIDEYDGIEHIAENHRTWR